MKDEHTQASQKQEQYLLDVLSEPQNSQRHISRPKMETSECQKNTGG